MDTLEKYGYSFQTKVLTSLITDRDFLVQNIDLIDSSYFSNKALKWLVDQTLFYFKETKQQPTLDVFKIQISNITDELFKTEIVTTLKDSFKAVDSTDLLKIKETVVQFCKHQEIAKAYINSTDDYKKGNYEEILKKFDTAIKKGQIAVDFGHNYIEDLEYRYTEQAEPERVPTGFKVLDEVFNGGLPKGTMGIIIAPSGIGKCIGPKTNIEIEYEEIGLEINNEIVWFAPWDKIEYEGDLIFVHEYVKVIEQSGIG